MYVDRQTAKLLKVTSKYESRGMLQGVHMTPDYAEATDGQILARVPHPTCATPDEAPANWQPMAAEAPAGQVIHANSLADLARALPKKDRGIPVLTLAAVGRAVEGGLIGVTGLPTEERRLTLEVIEGTFPNSGSIWPQGEVKFRVALSPRLLRVLAELGENDAETSVVFNLRNLDDHTQPIEFAIAGSYDRRPITGLVMPMRLPKPPRVHEPDPEPEGTEPQDPAEEPEVLLEGEPSGVGTA